MTKDIFELNYSLAIGYFLDDEKMNKPWIALSAIRGWLAIDGVRAEFK